jgi:hypothetical protein
MQNNENTCGSFNIQYNYSSASTAGFHTVDKKEHATGLFTGNLRKCHEMNIFFCSNFCISADGFHNVWLPICGENKNFNFFQLL